MFFESCNDARDFFRPFTLLCLFTSHPSTLTVCPAANLYHIRSLNVMILNHLHRSLLVSCMWYLIFWITVQGSRRAGHCRAGARRFDLSRRAAAALGLGLGGRGVASARHDCAASGRSAVPALPAAARRLAGAAGAGIYGRSAESISPPLPTRGQIMATKSIHSHSNELTSFEPSICDILSVFHKPHVEYMAHYPIVYRLIF